MTFLLVLLLLVPAPSDTLHLAALQRQALEQDPRRVQVALHAAATDLALRSLSARHLPQFALGGQAGYQSDVPELPFSPPGGSPPSFPKDRYQVTFGLDQTVYDGAAVARQRALEEAKGLRAQEAVRVDLYALQEQVNEAFFAALLLQEQAALLAVLEEDIRAKLALVEVRLRRGAALPGAADALRAELLRTAQQQMEVRARRQTALATLAELTGRPISEEAVLAPPDVPAPDTDARARPEYALFDRTRRQLRAQAALADVRRRPQVAAFTEVGYGRPGLDLFSDDFQAFWQAGLRMRWTFWDWGTVRREQEALALQERIVAAEEAAFTRRLRLEAEQTRREIERLEEVLRLDEELVALRQQIARQAASQLEHGVLTPADYLEKRNDAHEARLRMRVHRLELLQANVRYLTTLGGDLP